MGPSPVNVGKPGEEGGKQKVKIEVNQQTPVQRLGREQRVEHEYSASCIIGSLGRR